MTGPIDWAARIARHITEDGSVLIPPRIANWLERQAGVTADRRIMLRDTDPQAYEVLAAVHIAALNHRSGNGTKPVGVPSNPKESEVWLTTSEAADHAGVTDRAVGNWCNAGTLPARKHGGRWLINRNDITIYAHTA
jgi:excisionase family DNA binding protein